MLKLRKTHAEVLVHGIFKLIDDDNPSVFSFIKTSPDTQSKAIVICNFSDKESKLPTIDGLSSSNMLIDNVSEAGTKDQSMLQPWEARLYIST